MDQTDPIENYVSIRDELIQYNSELGSRPEIVVVTKSELPDSESVRTSLQERIGKEVLLISAVTGDGLPKLVQKIAQTLEQQAACN